MAELIVDADAEQFLVDWLPGQLEALGLEAKADKRKVLPKALGPHVSVRRVGGPHDSRVVDRARVMVTCQGPDPYHLMQLVRALINSMPRQKLVGILVYRVVEVSGVAGEGDLNGGTRYSQTFELYTRSTVLSA